MGRSIFQFLRWRYIITFTLLFKILYTPSISNSEDLIVGNWLLKSYSLNGCMTSCPGRTECSPGNSISCYTQNFIFNADGTFSRHESAPDGTTGSDSGTWVLNGNTLTVTSGGVSESVTVSITYDSLTMTYIDFEGTNIAIYERTASCGNDGDTKWTFEVQ